MPTKTQSGDAAAASSMTDWAAVAALSDDEVDAAALADPDAPPHTGPALQRLALAKRARLAVRLTREEFAARYGIPEETLRAWERHEASPDAVAQSYLRTILADPGAVAAAFALSKAPSQAAE